LHLFYQSTFILAMIRVKDAGIAPHISHEGKNPQKKTEAKRSGLQ